MKLPSLVAVTLAAVSAVAAAACFVALLKFQKAEFALTGAVLLLALAQIASYLARTEAASARDRLDLVRSIGQMSREVDEMRQRVGEVEAKFADADALAEAAGRMQDEVRTLQQTVARFSRASQGRNRRNDRPQRGSRSAETSRQTSHRIPDTPDDPYADDALPEHDLLLEPIVRLETVETAYYRASLDLAERPHGGDPVLDYTTMREVLPVIRRLKAKGRGTAVICPVTSRSLGDQVFIAKLIDLLGNDPDTISSLVLDVDQHTFVSLSPRGLEGLAWLGEHGAQFCLSGADTSSPDIPSLAKLRFGFLDVDARRVRAAATTEPLAARYVATRLFRNASQHGVAVIASALADEDALQAVSGHVAYARGPLFSPPRRVRHEAAREPPRAA